MHVRKLCTSQEVPTGSGSPRREAHVPGGGALETHLPGPVGPPTVTAAPGLGCELASALMVTRLHADLKSLCLWMKQHLHGVNFVVLQEEGIRSEAGWREGRKVRGALGPWKELQERVQEGLRPPGLWSNRVSLPVGFGVIMAHFPAPGAGAPDARLDPGRQGGPGPSPVSLQASPPGRGLQALQALQSPLQDGSPLAGRPP